MLTEKNYWGYCWAIQENKSQIKYGKLNFPQISKKKSSINQYFTNQTPFKYKTVPYLKTTQTILIVFRFQMKILTRHLKTE